MDWVDILSFLIDVIMDWELWLRPTAASLQRVPWPKKSFEIAFLLKSGSALPQADLHTNHHPTFPAAQLFTKITGEKRPRVIAIRAQQIEVKNPIAKAMWEEKSLSRALADSNHTGQHLLKLCTGSSAGFLGTRLFAHDQPPPGSKCVVMLIALCDHLSHGQKEECSSS